MKLLALGLLVLLSPVVTTAAVRTATFRGAPGYLRIELLGDNLCHFELSHRPFAPGTAIWTSPMVEAKTWPGPSRLDVNGRTVETPGFKLTVADNLCLRFEDRAHGYLTTLCPDRLNEEVHALTIDPGSMRHAYGIGQYFYDSGHWDESADGDWVGRVFEPGEHGNNMHSFKDKGAPSFTQFPVMYAAGDRGENYALFLDEPYKMRWNLAQSWWRVDIFGEREPDRHDRGGERNDPIRGYFLTGENLPALRHTYLGLTGRPPVPPKSVFGLWVAEFGYENWEQITGAEPKPHSGILEGLRRNKFPVDGFALDLQWYGNGFFEDDKRWMGTLEFDPREFPNATRVVADLKRKGVELMLIEQSYVDEHLVHGVKRNGVEHNEYSIMAEGGFLAREGGAKAPYSTINHNPWWGVGGIIDWTNPGAGATWFAKKRLPLVQMGITAHWTDLGEPEMYHSQSWYHGFPEIDRHRHHDIHNVFNLKWLQSIADGYRANGRAERHYSMSRSGGPGIQRFGAGMWSGDVGAHMNLLRSHYNAKLHMTFAGIDYYKADIGGFHRWAIDGDPNELYTQWFADGSLLDIPVSPHAWNLSDKALKAAPLDERLRSKKYETSPDRIGYFDSNRENLRLRYELAPYYYSLAHEAYLHGDPIFPPLVYQYQTDPNVRGLGNEVLIGRDLLVAIVAGYGETERNVYLPAGGWVDFHTSEPVEGGRWVRGVPVWRQGKFKLPLFARAGTILPKMRVDDGTLNIRGLRADGKPADDLVVRVYPTEKKTGFTLYEDDGTTIAYQNGRDVRTTLLEQKRDNGRVSVTIHAAKGRYDGERRTRGNLVELVLGRETAREARLGGERLPACKSTQEARAMARPCFANAGDTVLVSTGPRDVGDAKAIEVELGDAQPLTVQAYFICANGPTVPGESVYVTGSLPELGGWDLKRAVKLDPFPYPKWTGTLTRLSPNTPFEWRCVKLRQPDQSLVQWDAGNKRGTTPAEGTSVHGATF